MPVNIYDFLYRDMFSNEAARDQNRLERKQRQQREYAKMLSDATPAVVAQGGVLPRCWSRSQRFIAELQQRWDSEWDQS